MSRNKPQGFTLVELLVVVAIVVVLMGLLVPAIDRAIGYAQEARCLANLHQVGTGLRMYTMDYRGFFPPKYMPGTTTGGEYVAGQGVQGMTNTVSIYWWVGTAGNSAPFDTHGANERYINPYLGFPTGVAPDAAVHVAQCPADNDTVRAYDQVGTSYASNHSYTMSSLMAYNLNYVNTVNADPVSNHNYYSGIKVTRVQNGSRLVAGGDAPGISVAWNKTSTAMPWHRAEQDQRDADGAPMYSFALVFVDAHAAMETYPRGQSIGSAYTFDEYGREPRP